MILHNVIQQVRQQQQQQQQQQQKSNFKDRSLRYIAVKNQKSRLRQVFNFTRKIPTKRCDSLGKKTRPEINDHVKLGRFHRLLTY